MDWRRTLPLLLLLLNGWIAIGFMPATFVGPASLVVFAALTAVGIMSGLARKREPREAEQNILAVSLILILVAGIVLDVLVRFYEDLLDGEAAFLLVFPLWALVSGYTVGRYWSVPSMSRPPGSENKAAPAGPPSDPAATGLDQERGAT